jgi:hypothetical protein
MNVLSVEEFILLTDFGEILTNERSKIEPRGSKPGTTVQQRGFFFKIERIARRNTRIRRYSGWSKSGL